MSPGISTGWPTARYCAGTCGWPGGYARGRALAMDADAAALAVDGEGLELGDVVADVVDHVDARAPAPPAADRLGEASRTQCVISLAVGEREVGRRRHGAEVALALGRSERRAAELAVGQLDPVLRRGAASMVLR